MHHIPLDLESNAGESPVCLLNSCSPILLRNRSRRSLFPIPYFFSPAVIVSDAIWMFVFLSRPVPPIFFRSGKPARPKFLTVKHFFLKIKSWPDEIRPIEKGKDNFHEEIRVVAAALVIIGALNWGLAGVFHLDLVATVFGMKFGETSGLSTVVYGLVGLSGLYQALTWKSIQRRWHIPGTRPSDAASRPR